MSKISELPVIGGALNAAGTGSTAVLGLAAKGSSPAATAAYNAAYKTNEGGTPGLFDIGATARALAASEQARQQELGAIASDTSLSAGERAKAAAGATLYGALPYVLPMPGLKGTGSAFVQGLKGAAPDVARAAAEQAGALHLPAAHVPLDAEQLAARTGGITAAQRAANDALAQQVAAKSNVIPFPNTPETLRNDAVVAKTSDYATPGTPGDAFPKSPEATQLAQDVAAPQPTRSLADALTSSFDAKRRRMENVATAVANRAPVSAAQASELLDFLKAEAPSDAATFQRALQPIIDAENAAKQSKLYYVAQDKTATQSVRAVNVTETRLNRADQTITDVQARYDKMGAALSDRQTAAMDRFEVGKAAAAGRIDAAEQVKLEAQFAQMDRAMEAQGLPPDMKVKVLTSIPKADAAKAATTGYFAPRDEQVLADASINTGKWQDPVAIRTLADTVRANPETFADATKTVSYTEQVQKAARFMGMEPDQITAELARRGLAPGQGGPLLYAANATLEQMAGDYGRLVRSGASEADLAAADAKFLSFTASVGGASSEAGRTLGLLKVQRGQPFIEAIRTRNSINSTQGALRNAEAALAKAQDRATTITDSATQARDAAATMAEGKQKDLAARFADQKATLAQEAQAAYEKASAARDAAKSNYDDAVMRAAEASTRAQAAALKAAALHGLDKEVRKVIALIDPSDTEAIVNAMRNMTKLSTGERFIAWVSNNSYSGVAAETSNAIGGALRAAENLAVAGVAEVGSNVVGKITGRRSIVPGEFQRQVAGTLMALQDAPRIWSDVMLKGISDKTVLSVNDLRRSAFPGKKGLLFEGFLRLNGSFDSVTKHIVNLSEQNALYLRRATEDLGPGVTPEQIGQRVQELRANPPADLLDAAGTAAADVTYGGNIGGPGRNILDEFVTRVINHGFNLSVPGASRLANVPVLGGMTNLGPTPLLKAVFLATKFSLNATKYSLTDLSPLGFIKAGMTAAKGPEFARAATLQTARATVGSAMLASGFALYANGLLIGTDPEHRGRDDSVLVNGKWTPISNAYPLSAPLLFAAHIADEVNAGRMNDENLLQLMKDSVVGIGKAMGSAPVLRTTHDLYDAISRGGKVADKAFAQIADRLTPAFAFQRDVQRMLDSAAKDPNGFWQAVETNILGLGSGVSNEVDRWGQPKPLYGAQGANRLNPFASGEVAQTALDKQLAPLEQKNPKTDKPYISITPLTDTVASVKLVEGDANRWKSLGGQMRATEIQKVMASPDFASLSKDEQAKRVNQAEATGLDKAKQQFANELVSGSNPEQKAAGLAVGLSAATSNFERAALVDTWKGYFSDPVFTQKLRDSLPQRDSAGNAAPTLEDYRTVYPMLKQMQTMPKFADGLGNPIGNQKIWDQYTAEKKLYDKIGADFTKSAIDRKIAQASFKVTHLVFVQYSNLANRSVGENPQITALRRANPILARFPLPSD